MTGLVAASSDRLAHSLDKLTAGDGFELPDESGVGGRFGFPAGRRLCSCATAAIWMQAKG
jgi:hypothetical protein